MGLDSKMTTHDWTPADEKPLPKYEDGEEPLGTFSYSSVVGMILCVLGHSRPGIEYTVNCCAWYMFNPRVSHKKTLKWSGRYRKATRDRELTVKHTRKWKVDAYPDAIFFPELYGHEKPSDPICIKRQTRFLMKILDCPVVWISKLQSETVLLTTEAEINALSHYCRRFFLWWTLFKKLGIQLDWLLKLWHPCKFQCMRTTSMY